MSPRRSPVSGITGQRQGPVLRVATVLAFLLALASVLTEGQVTVVTGTAAVTVVVAVPLLRVLWLLIRWAQERDWRFVAVATGLLAVVGLGAFLTLLAT